MTVVTTELVRFAEEDLGVTTAQAIVGRHPGADLRALATALAAPARLEPAELLQRFGRNLFPRFAAVYPAFVAADSAFELMRELGPRIHAGLQELYPEAAFPHLECTDGPQGELVVTYRSERGLADLAEGLLAGCVEYFGEDVHVRGEAASDDGTTVRFVLRIT
jgi:hypothetical protein